jgi:tRNA G18 (ribose-2'-O)-methylase SpoU
MLGGEWRPVTGVEGVAPRDGYDIQTTIDIEIQEAAEKALREQIAKGMNIEGGTAIVMGTEATGLTDCWRRAADAHIKIPMLGKLDSLNVSVSAAILMFEAVRQRNA